MPHDYAHGSTISSGKLCRPIVCGLKPIRRLAAETHAAVSVAGQETRGTALADVRSLSLQSIAADVANQEVVSVRTRC